MRQRFGIYRRAFGDVIVESSFNFDTSTIGPYKIPITLPFHYDYISKQLPKYRFYEEMLKSREALAVVDINGSFFAIIEKTRCYLVSASDGLECNIRTFDTPLDVPDYRHVGYRKTYPKNLSVYHYPWYLLQNVETGEVLDFEHAVLQEVLVEPHVGLYKSLIDTPYDAVFFDTYLNQIAYLSERS